MFFNTPAIRDPLDFLHCDDFFYAKKTEPPKELSHFRFSVFSIFLLLSFYYLKISYFI
ncbi:hypothetical protein EVA_14457 [gut metagenome]|uniref:Uncharacterized protein n=1 Tax=gut metagenome TaxID=749906 RepID=J9G6L5_9ZZZZ